LQLEQASLFSMKLVLILGVFAISCVPFIASAADQPSKNSKKNAKSPQKVQPLVCDSPTLNLPQSSQAVPGGHSVTLSWNASVPSPGHGPAAGYCVYRSSKQGDALLGKGCKECELLNKTPLPPQPTACVDYPVTNATVYYYAVTAVNKGGVSGPSNETAATITAGKPASSQPNGIASCNGTNSASNIESTPQK
jgi:hypothetical protein